MEKFRGEKEASGIGGTGLDPAVEQIWFTYAQSPIPTMLRNAAGNILRLNSAMEELTGYSHADVPTIDAWYAKLYPDEEYRTKTLALSRKSWRGGHKIHRQEFDFTSKDGLEKSAEFSVFDIYLEGKKTELKLVQAIERTEHKKLVEDLLRQKELLSKVIASIPHHVFWKDRNSVYLGCNHNFASVAGLSTSDEIVGKTDYDLPWSREESDWYRKVDADVMSSGMPRLNFEERQTQADGVEKIVLTSKVLLRDDRGEVFGILGLYSDITEKKVLELKLAESERKHRELAELLPTTVFEMNPSTRITYVNKAATEMYGYNKEEFYSMSSAGQLIVPEQHDKLAAELGLLLGGNRIENSEYTLIRKDGSTFIGNVTVDAFEANGRIAMLRGICIDVTEKKRQEEERENSAKVEAIGNLLVTLSHEMNQSLAVICSGSSVLMESLEKGSEEYEDAENINKACWRIAQLIKKILRLKRVKSMPYSEISDMLDLDGGAAG